MKEIWKKVPLQDFPDYEISNYGKVRRGSRLRKNLVQNSGYYSVDLFNHCKMKHFLVHRLVAMAFIPTDDLNLDVNHKDGNKKNNYVDNLEWVTRSQNLKHAYKLGLKGEPSERQRRAWRETGLNTKNLKPVEKKAVIGVSMDGKDIKKFDSIHAAFSFLNCTVCGAISRCCHGRKKSYKGYKWRFAND